MTLSTITRTHKNSVRVTTTGNITLVGLQTIDSVSLIPGDRVLVKDQITSTQNGIYIASSGVWIRSPDADKSDEFLPGMQIYVAEGAVNAKRIFQLTTISPINLNITSLDFEQLVTGSSPGSTTTTLGNPDLLPQLNTSTSFLQVYCSPSGNDIIGNGSINNPFRNIQRALDELPDGCSGVFQIECLAGNYFPFTLRPLYTPFGLQVIVVGDRTVQSAAPLQQPASIQPPLNTAPSKVNSACYQYTFDNSLGVAFSRGSHWLDVDANGVCYTTTIDGENSSGAVLRIVEQYDFINAFTSFPVIRPFVSSIDGSSATMGVDNQFNIGITNQNLNNDYGTAGVTLWVKGMRIAADYEVRIANCNLYASLIDCSTDTCNVLYSHNQNCSLNNTEIASQIFLMDGNNTFFGGLHCSNVVVDGPTSETFIYGVFRGRDGSGVTLYIGGPTGGRIGSATDVEIEFAHFENQGFVQVQAAAVRWGNHAPVSVDGPPGLIVARYGARIRAQDIYGTTATVGASVIAEAGVHLYAGFGPLQGNLVNTTVSGNDVLIRKDTFDTGIVFQFNELPQTVLSYLTRVE